MKRISPKEGKELVSLARKSIEYYFHTNKILDYCPKGKVLEESCGVFVTLHCWPSNELRGCIGFPEPVMPLYRAVIEAAVSSAFSDDRFPKLQFEELGSIIIEVSVLTKPEEIKFKSPEGLKKKIIIGKHGLIAEKGFSRGLLLPQVPLEWKWDSGEFLENSCMKAGLSRDCWKDGKTRFYSFEGIIFREKKPKGEVEKIKG